MGGSTQQAPTAYQPTNQAGADQSFQAGAQNLQNTGTQLSSQVTPQLGAIAGNVVNNPYYSQALAGAQGAAGAATGQVAPQQLQSAQDLAGLSSLAASKAGSAYDTAVAGGQNAYNTANSYIPITTNPELQAGLQTLMTGFDPQNALYNQQQQQNLDQQNAIQSMSGTAGSPYGAGLTSQSNQNFNINWQQQQLARQIAALGAYDSASSTATGNLTNLLNTGTGALNAGINTGVGALSNLTNTAGSAATTSSNLGTAGLNTMATAAQLPYDLFLQQQQAGLGALGSQIGGTNAANALTQTGTADQGTYLQIGQGATQVNDQAVAANNKAAADSAAGFGNLFGQIGSMFLFA
jgi:hypothetical protein